MREEEALALRFEPLMLQHDQLAARAAARLQPVGVDQIGIDRARVGADRRDEVVLR